jgi:putative Ca2+/H+ antiporter (TMEM165/GDT1 family)
LQAFLVSVGVVALAEIGDKTQLLSLLLAARFRRPWPVIAGIFVASLLNHAAAGAVGAWVMAAVGPVALRWGLGLSFLAMAAWMLVPDKLDEVPGLGARLGAFGTTAVAIFLAEMGDKTQIATVALAAHYRPLLAVIAGTTIGMLLANAPVVLMGERVMQRLPVRAVHAVGALLFAALGIAVLLGH